MIGGRRADEVTVLVSVCVNPGKNGKIVVLATVLMLLILVNVS